MSAYYAPGTVLSILHFLYIILFNLYSNSYWGRQYDHPHLIGKHTVAYYSSAILLSYSLFLPASGLLYIPGSAWKAISTPNEANAYSPSRAHPKHHFFRKPYPLNRLCLLDKHSHSTSTLYSFFTALTTIGGLSACTMSWGEELRLSCSPLWGKGVGRKIGRESSMWERNIDRFPLP